MVALVTLEQVRAALRIGEYEEASGGGYTLAPHIDDNILNEVYIPAASGAVITHLKDQATELLGLDEFGELASGSEVPEQVQVATILLIMYWYDSPREDFDDAELPPPVKALLKPLRDPTLA